MASCCDYIVCPHSVNFVHLTCRCEMSCMSGNTDCGGPKFCILNTDTYVGKIMKKLPKSPQRFIFSENWSYAIITQNIHKQFNANYLKTHLICRVQTFRTIAFAPFNKIFRINTPIFLVICNKETKAKHHSLYHRSRHYINITHSPASILNSENMVFSKAKLLYCRSL